MKWISKNAVMTELDSMYNIAKEYEDEKAIRVILRITDHLNRLPAHEFELDQEVKDDKN